MSFLNILRNLLLFDFLFGKSSRNTPRKPAATTPHLHSCSYCECEDELEATRKELREKLRETEERLEESCALLDEYQTSEIDADNALDEVAERIYRLEKQLDECELMSDRYHEIQNQIERLDDLRYDLEEMQDDLDNIQDDLDDIEDRLDDYGLDREDSDMIMDHAIFNDDNSHDEFDHDDW